MIDNRQWFAIVGGVGQWLGGNGVEWSLMVKDGSRMTENDNRQRLMIEDDSG